MIIPQFYFCLFLRKRNVNFPYGNGMECNEWNDLKKICWHIMGEVVIIHLQYVDLRI